jgi:lipoprotein LprG
MKPHLLKRNFAAVLVSTAIVVSAACGGPEDLTPEQVIEKSAPAMQEASSFHVTLDLSQVGKAPPGLFLTGADADIVKPDKLQAEVSAIYSGLPIEVKVIVDGEKQYMTDPASGKWQVMPPALNIVQFFDPSKGVADMLTNLKDLEGHGRESIGDTDSYVVKGKVPTSALSAFSPEVTASGDLTTTLWVGATDFLVRRAQIEGPLTASEPAEVVRTFHFRDYNKDIKIDTPVVE